ncbi:MULTISPECIES: class I SAM-dependent DNA methyltransferase [Pseudonocardia]|uniref:site-specific DNA-methyltransferase (adenine-specific) n=2 Tax=Pseudonocardia TaxID=1847 RepID=A0A1Y2MP01_PSEAH|nr:MULTISPECIES: class I SAM-dependent DNA methyltransferase [Pseudonocardia]OSY36871.1 putative type I restriction enzymeP M protein [Pseudonocardia autotrophica]TDN76861.1 type I restriction enzyme M protein [Pseudonocardia autotrophica]BBG00863.1 DNA methyltransferase [Pseudonocardia autotrophica]GEC28870.1 DNA methyltransferase [Pseudonocardia saturnea]
MTVPKTAAEAKQLVDKLWSYCHVLRHDGVSTIDYVDQLTLLLFLKMAEERAGRTAFGGGAQIVPKQLSWQTLLDADAKELKQQYEKILEKLGEHPETALGLIYQSAENKIRDPATLRRLIVDLVDKVNWSLTGVDIKGDAYEALLEKGAEDVKSGAGQYFTPRPLIDAMVRCVQPRPDDTIADPACGTGGFLLAAHDYIQRHHTKDLTAEEAGHLRGLGISGVELVHGTARLAQMNLLLHGIGESAGKAQIDVRDALARPPRADERASLVLANPPFGRKSGFSSVDEFGKVTREDAGYDRSDFWVTTSNKQLNFVQHIALQLKIDGRAAVVVPDNVLFEGGAGETLRRRLLTDCNVHTLLRLPTGIFYAGGVKANVLFFDAKRARPETPWTSELWVYDLRTSQHFTLRQNKLAAHHLDDFVDRYHRREESDRFRRFTYDELVARDKVNLDITWLSDNDTEELPPPDVLAQEIVEDLQVALTEFAAVADALQLAATEREGNTQEP